MRYKGKNEVLSRYTETGNGKPRGTKHLGPRLLKFPHSKISFSESHTSESFACELPLLSSSLMFLELFSSAFCACSIAARPQKSNLMAFSQIKKSYQSSTPWSLYQSRIKSPIVGIGLTLLDAAEFDLKLI